MSQLQANQTSERETETPTSMPCSSCGAIINNILPSNGPNTTEDTTHNEVRIPEPCTLISISGPSSQNTYLAFCKNCDRFLDILNEEEITHPLVTPNQSGVGIVGSNTNEPISRILQTQHGGENIHAVVSFKVHFNNTSMGDGPRNRNPCVVSINNVQLYMGNQTVSSLEQN